jgi:hypothetical protein
MDGAGGDQPVNTISVEQLLKDAARTDDGKTICPKCGGAYTRLKMHIRVHNTNDPTQERRGSADSARSSDRELSAIETPPDNNGADLQEENRRLREQLQQLKDTQDRFSNVCQSKKAWRERNREKCYEYTKRWRENNKEKNTEYMRNWRAKRKEATV